MKPDKSMLLEKTRSLLEEFKSSNPERESLEWYLINNLTNYLNTIDQANKPYVIKSATANFGRFCTESMDWDTALNKKCTAITEIGYQLGRDD